MSYWNEFSEYGAVSEKELSFPFTANSSFNEFPIYCYKLNKQNCQIIQCILSVWDHILSWKINCYNWIPNSKGQNKITQNVMCICDNVCVSYKDMYSTYRIRMPRKIQILCFLTKIHIFKLCASDIYQKVSIYRYKDIFPFPINKWAITFSCGVLAAYWVHPISHWHHLCKSNIRDTSHGSC